ncbi:MAG: hypothetical protein QXF05_05120 [Thermofilaceae archaeon]
MRQFEVRASRAAGQRAGLQKRMPQLPSRELLPPAFAFPKLLLEQSSFDTA